MKVKLTKEELFLELHKESELWANILKAYALVKNLKQIIINLGSSQASKMKMQTAE